VSEPELEKRFLYQTPGPVAQWRHAAINSVMLDAARKICGLTPACREQALALTALQDAKHWANAAVACNQELLPAAAPEQAS